MTTITNPEHVTVEPVALNRDAAAKFLGVSKGQLYRVCSAHHVQVNVFGTYLKSDLERLANIRRKSK